MRNETIQDITLKDLLSFYSNDKFPELLASLESVIKEAITKLEFIKNSSNVDTCTPAELHSYLVQNNVAFMNAIRNCMTIASGVFSLGQLNFNTSILFEELKKA
jgi:ArsR family metal-binding transcriptional regulator